MRKTLKTVRLDVAKLPELATEVGMSGSARRQEVGGAVCLLVAAGVAVYIAQ